MSKTEKVSKIAEPKLKIKSRKKITGIPFLKIEALQPVYVKMTSPITAGLMKKKPANFVNIENLETGEVQKLLLGTVLCRQILENFPENSHIGKSFEIIKGEKVKGENNDYYEFELNEIEV